MAKKKHLRFKHFLTTVLWSVVLAGLLVVMGFVNISRNKEKCTGLKINVNYSNGMNFLDDNDIREQVYAVEGDLIGRELKSIDIAKLEREVSAMNAVKNAEVYSDLKGNIIIDIIQRRPVARIFAENGKSGYLDETGKWMELSGKYTARVIVINGNIPPMAEGKAVSSDEDVVAFWDGMNNLIKTIGEDEFLKAQFEQIYVNKNREVILIPRVGKHSIMLGKPDHLSGKFEKLKLFYKDGLSRVDWNRYKQIDLRYKDQVVCTKR